MSEPRSVSEDKRIPSYADEAAFPRPRVERLTQQQREMTLLPEQFGLTKREIFALVSMHAHRVGLLDEDPGQIALYAVADADALLKELARG